MKDTFPVGVASERDESATVARQTAFDPACSGEGVQSTFTTMPRRLVELVVVECVVVVEEIVDVVIEELEVEKLCVVVGWLTVVV